MRRLIIVLLTLAFTPAAFAQQHHGTHEHGVAELRVAVDGPALLVELESPLDNLVGFEHAPRDQEQRDALASAEQTLAQFHRLFDLPAAAACTLKEVHLQSPWPQSEDHHRHEHEHDHQDGETHADMRIHYELACAQPQALSSVAVKLFDAFPRIHHIRAETATPRGQGSATLSPASRRLDL